MKKNWTSVKKEFWKLVDKIDVIYIVVDDSLRENSGIDKKAAGHSTMKNDRLTIVLDVWLINIEETIIHELMHWVFDDLWIKTVSYSIYEEWIVAFEEKFRKTLTWKERDKLRRKLQRLVVVKRG